MGTIEELLERVKAATGPDRSIDVMTECATGPWRAWSMSGGIVVPDGEPDYWVFNDEQADAFIAAYPKLQDRYARIPEFGTPFITDPAAPGDLYRKGFVSIHKNDNRRTVPSYTASIDAVLALTERVLPGWGIEIGRPAGRGGIGNARLYPGDERNAELTFFGMGETPALAILAALLSALAQVKP